jgi:tetratricopeptide (TPR) repeat protein
VTPPRYLDRRKPDTNPPAPASGRAARSRWAAALLLLAAGATGAAAFLAGRGRGHPDAATARRAVRDREYAAAIGPLDRWLRDRPSDAEPHALRARVAYAQGDLARAGEELRRARSLGLAGRESSRLEALLLARSGRGAEAEGTLAALLKASDEPDPEAAEALARIFLQTYRLRAAQAALERWARDAPEDARPYLGMTQIDARAEQGGPARAVEHFREALRRDPRLDEARLGLAEALRETHRYDEAEAEFARYRGRRPDDPAGHLGAGRVALALGRPDEAAKSLDRALELDPDHAAALRERAGIDLGRGEVEAALGRLDRALAIDPFDSEAHSRRGLALARLGRYDEAKAEQARAEQLREDELSLQDVQRRFNADPHDDALRLEIARWMFDHGQGEQGVRWIKTVLSGAPSDPEANGLLAEYYEARGDPGLANFYRLRAGPGPRAD